MHYVHGKACWLRAGSMGSWAIKGFNHSWGSVLAEALSGTFGGYLPAFPPSHLISYAMLFIGPVLDWTQPVYPSGGSATCYLWQLVRKDEASNMSRTMLWDKRERNNLLMPSALEEVGKFTEIDLGSALKLTNYLFRDWEDFVKWESLPSGLYLCWWKR